MQIYDYIFDVIKYFVAGMAIFGAAYALLKPQLQRADRIQMLELRRAVSNQTLPLRLQAYERVVLFIERINPSNMLIRLNGTAYTAAELQAMVTADIRDEYQHNVSQQIYVSTRAWGTLRRIKDDTLGMVTNAMRGLPEDATGLDLARLVLTHLSQQEENPYDIALAIIRQDLEELF